MIKPYTDSLSVYLKDISFKTLIIACNDWNGDSYLKINSNITLMSVFGLNLESAGYYTMQEIATAIDIFGYTQIILLTDHPCRVQEKVINGFVEDTEIYSFVKVIAQTKIQVQKEGLLLSDNLITTVIYLGLLGKFLRN